MTETARFNRPARLLHWTMAALILAMLLIGAAMVAFMSFAAMALLASTSFAVVMLSAMLVSLAVSFFDPQAARAMLSAAAVERATNFLMDSLLQSRRTPRR